MFYVVFEFDDEIPFLFVCKIREEAENMYSQNSNRVTMFETGDYLHRPSVIKFKVNSL